MKTKRDATATWIDGSTLRQKSKAAMMLGHLGGLRGGHARAASLSADRRKEIARLAAQARWQRTPGEEEK